MGLKYQSSFDSMRGLECSLEIYAKGYTGDVIDIVLTDNPIIQSWNTDEAKPAIKGCGVVINILNEGALPVTDFMASEDDYFKVIIKVNGNTVFEGYLVQDDYDEILVDYPHEISLKATDNLGLLKDVSLGDAAITFGDPTTTTQTIEQSGTDKIKITGTVPISQNQVIIIDSGTALDGQYAVKTWQYLAGPFTEVTFESGLNGTVVGSTSADMTYIMPVDLTERMYLSEILALCLKSTNLPLEIRVFGTVYPDGAADERLFDNTMITPESFLSGTKWDSCYTIIEKILRGDNEDAMFTLLQAEGYWNIVRWDELRLHANEIPGHLYDSDFVYDSDITLNNQFFSGFEEATFPEEGLSYSVQRPLKFARETFNYRNPENIIKNINFTEVGELLSVTPDGTDTIYDYRMVGWEQGFEWTGNGLSYIGSNSQRIIRVIVDEFENEKDRYGVIKGPSGLDQKAAAQSNGVEVRQGDRIKLSFDFRLNGSFTGPSSYYFIVNLLTTANPVPRNANNRYLKSNGKWKPYGYIGIDGGAYILYQVPFGDNSNTWHTVTIESEAIPFDGLVLVKLAQSFVLANSSSETQYKNIRFEVIRQIAGSIKVIGQQSTSSQLPNIKNSQEKEIYVDEAPNNAIAGALYLPTFTGPVQDLVVSWKYNGEDYDKLGHITTRDELFLRRIPRLKLEGTMYHLEQDDKILSALSVLQYAQFTGSNFVSGKLTLDYSKDKATLTLFEMHNDSEEDTDLREIYGFRYLYEKS